MFIIQAESTKQAGSVRPTVTVHIRHIVIKVGALYEASHLYITPVIVPTLIMSPQSLPVRAILRSDHVAEDAVKQRGFDQPVVFAQGLPRGGGVGGEEPKQQ